MYGRALGFEFVYDDRVLIEGNAALGDASTLVEALTHDLFHFAGDRVSPYWRPLVTLTYYVEYAVFGGAAWGFHLANLVWALLATMGLFVLVRAHHGERTALVCAALFVCHPLLVEPVVNVASRTDMLCAALALAALRVRPAWAFVLTLLACGAKEPAVLLPLAALVWAPRDVRWKVMGLAVLVYLGCRAAVFFELPPDAAPPTLASIIGAGERALQLMSRIVLPLAGSPAAEVPPASGGLAVLGWLGVAVVAVGVARLRGLGRVGAVLLLGPLMLVSGLLQGEPRFGDGLVLLPLVGALLIAAPWVERVPTWAAVLALAGLAGLGQMRVGDWRDEATLWEATHERLPSDPAVSLNLARTVVQEDPARAEALLAEVAFADARRQGEVGEVRAFAAQALGQDPRGHLVVALDGDPSPWAAASACVLALPTGCVAAIELAPADPAVWNAYAIELGPGPQRVEAFRTACRLSPDEGPYCANATRSELELAPPVQDGLP